jgi:diguanylate cyclase (GGDEF)-like protein
MSLTNHWLTHFFDDTVSNNVDKKRRLYSFLAFSYVGCFVLAVFSYKNNNSDTAFIFVITSITSLLFLINIVIFHVYKNLDACCKAGSIGIIIFCLTLVYHGGIDNTALYWIFPFPLVLFVLLGAFNGAIANSFVFILLLIILNNHEFILASYSSTETIRFLSSFLVINIMSFINEYFREHSHSTMTDLNINKEQQANTDTLTNLPNRRFVDSVFFPTSKVNSNDRFPMVVIMSDVDHFKSFNDNHGHQIGDKILEKLARTIEQCIRTEDIVARVGGEEFLLLFSNTGYELGLKIAEKIRNEICVMQLENEKEILNITMSFGVAIAQNHDEIESKLKDADAKLYKAKKSGRNCIC